MSNLEKFIHDEAGRTPTLLKAALAHVQFETIHPFLDGNGRLGRLLITLLLCTEQALAQPLLYLSLYLKNRRNDYYELLQRVRTNGEWEAWIRFFLDGVLQTSQGAYETAQEIVRLFADHRRRIKGFGRAAGSALRVHESMQRHPITDSGRLCLRTGLTLPTVLSALSNLEQVEIVQEITGRSRRRLFTYSSYLSILERGTEPLPR